MDIERIFTPAPGSVGSTGANTVRREAGTETENAVSFDGQKKERRDRKNADRPKKPVPQNHKNDAASVDEERAENAHSSINVVA